MRWEIHCESATFQQGEVDMPSRGNLSYTRGFTLIEISIVLVVIGLLISGGLVALAPVLENAKRTETENTMTKIEDALTLYAIQYGCLPCPADGSLASTNANAGRAEDNNGAFYDANCVDDNAGTSCNSAANTTNIIEVVPWRTLGLQEADAVDGWGNRINYHLVQDDPVYNGPTCTGPGTGPYVSGIYRCGVNFPGNSAGYFIVNDTTGAEITNAAQRAVYVIVSQGPDGDSAYASESGAQRANPRAGAASQNENTDGDEVFVQGNPIGIEGNTYFDDIVRWKTAPIFIQGCGESACGNAPYVAAP